MRERKRERREKEIEKRGQREKGEGKESIASLFSSYQREKADSIMYMIFILKGLNHQQPYKINQSLCSVRRK